MATLFFDSEQTIEGRIKKKKTDYRGHYGYLLHKVYSNSIQYSVTRLKTVFLNTSYTAHSNSIHSVKTVFLNTRYDHIYRAHAPRTYVFATRFRFWLCCKHVVYSMHQSITAFQKCSERSGV